MFISNFVQRRASKQVTQTATKAMSFWSHVTQAPPDAILGVSDAFKKDSDPRKVSLGVGAYRDNNGKPLVLECVKEAQKRIVD